MRVKHAASVLALCLLPGVSSAGILDSAIRFWSFDGTLVDSVANTGATSQNWTSGYAVDRDGNAGGALDLGGNLDAIIVNSSSLLSSVTNYSLSIWFQMNTHNLSLGRGHLFDTKGTGNSDRDSLVGFIDNTDAGNVSEANPEDGWLGTFSDQGLFLNEANNQAWQHLLFAITPSSQDIFFNGGLLSSVNYGSNSLNPTNLESGLVFGDKSNKIGELGFNFNGSLDDIALFDRTLSASDAAALYAA
ncbi:unnamed protein product, partial [Ectocarpus sp. 13 AM-2016]